MNHSLFYVDIDDDDDVVDDEIDFVSYACINILSLLA